MMDKSINSYSIKVAREFRNLSQSELSKKVGFTTSSKLSKIESGLLRLNVDNFNDLRKTLGFPEEFFKINFHSDLRNDFRYRSRKIAASIKSEIESNIHIVLSVIDKLISNAFTFKLFEFEEFINKPINSLMSIEEIALHFRSKLLMNPIIEDNLITKIEGLGIIVLEVEYSKYEDNDKLKVDGTSAVTKNGVPVIFINKHFPNCRKKFTLAHELGHVILHLFKFNNRLSEKEMEDEANRFAGEFLAPVNIVSKDLRELNRSKLKMLKAKYGVSMGSLLYRAKELNLISESTHKYLIIEMSRNGELKKEPIELNVNLDSPKSIQTILNHYEEELLYTDEELATLTNLFLRDYKKLKWLYFNNNNIIFKLKGK